MRKVAGYTEKLARFVLELSFADLPSRVVSETKFDVMDAVGNALCTLTMGDDTGRIIAALAQDMGGKGEARIIGSLVKVPAPIAAFTNGAFVRSLGFDDFHLTSAAHIFGPLFPAALAAGEMTKASGKKLIAALAAGFDVGVRVGLAARPEYWLAHNFDPSVICSVFGCTAAVGKLIKLSEAQMMNALGLAAAQASGIFGLKGGHMGFYFQQAKAAHSGTLAALLARRGMTGLTPVFDEERGFFTAFSEKPELSRLTRGLGKKFEIAETAYKTYPCEIFIAPGIEILLDMIREHDLDAEDVASIELKLPTHVAFMASTPGFPSSKFAARLSGRYVLSYTLLLKDKMRFNIEPFLDKGMKDPRLPKLIERINVTVDPVMDRPDPKDYGNIVILKTKKGKTYTGEKHSFKGNPKTPFTKEDYEEKFAKLAAYSIGPRKIKKIINTIEKLDELKDVTELVDLLKA